MMSDLIQGKVARILNSRELAINLGSQQGIEKGMLFDVLDLKGQNIKDPDTGKPLGSIDRSKVRVQVTDVKDQFCIASTFKKNQINVGGSMTFGPLAQTLLPSKWVTKYENLKIADQEKEDILESQSYVKVGDPVIQVLEDFKEVKLREAK